MSCSAVYCSSRTTKGGVKDPDLSFHLFPKCPEIRREWIKVVRRDNWEPTKHSRLCSKHFEETCFITGLSIKKLKSDAIPTIFEEYPLYYKPVVKKRKPPTSRDEVQGTITPRKRKKFEESGVNTQKVPTTLRRAVNVLGSLARSRAAALRRLRTIKMLRERNRRLEKKNATLLNIINNLKDKNLVETDPLALLC